MAKKLEISGGSDFEGHAESCGYLGTGSGIQIQ